MNKEQLLKEFDKRQKELRDEFIAKLEDDKKEFELTYPRDDSDIYFISNVDAEICFARFYSSNETDRCAFEHGLYFKTKEEAGQRLKERKLLFKLHQWTEMKNEGWKPDWRDDEDKFYLWHDSQYNELGAGDTRFSNRFNRLPYFKSREIAEECIDLFGDEIKEVFMQNSQD